MEDREAIGCGLMVIWILEILTSHRYLHHGARIVTLTCGMKFQFFVPECSECGGVLKPDVVFFGDSVPKATSEGAMEQVGYNLTFLFNVF